MLSITALIVIAILSLRAKAQRKAALGPGGVDDYRPSKFMRVFVIGLVVLAVFDLLVVGLYLLMVL